MPIPDSTRIRFNGNVARECGQPRIGSQTINVRKTKGKVFRFRRLEPRIEDGGGPEPQSD